MSTNRIILLADILGFSSIVQNFNEFELNLKIESWVNLIEVLTVKHNLTDYQLLSDTLFLTTYPNEDSFNQILGFSKDLLEEGLKKDIPIRGYPPQQPRLMRIDFYQ